MFSFRDQVASSTSHSSPVNVDNRVYLQVPYEEKNEAKSMGAKWDKDKKKWYTSSDNVSALAKWSEEARILTELIGEDRTVGGDALQVEFLPKKCWCKNIQYAIQRHDRDRVYDFVFGRTNRTCETCGLQDSNLDFHMHGRWIYEGGTQRLVRLMCLCERCYDATHFGASHFKGKRQEALAQLKKITKQSDAECENHINNAYEHVRRLNEQEWKVDLSLLTNNGIQCETESNLKFFFSKRNTSTGKESYQKTKKNIQPVEHRAGNTTYSFRST